MNDSLLQETFAAVDTDLGDIRRAVLRVIYDSSEPPAPERLHRRICLRRVLRKPCQIVPASFDESQSSAGVSPQRASRAHCRNISFDGIGLMLDEPIDAEFILVTFALEKQKNATFLVQVRWTNLVGTTLRLAGGAFVGVLSTPSETLGDEPAHSEVVESM